MLHKGYWCEEEKGPGLRWVAETFVSEAEVISLINTESDCEEFVELWQNGKSKEVKIKPKTNKQTKIQNTFRVGHHLRVIQKSCFVLLEQTSSRLKDKVTISQAAISLELCKQWSLWRWFKCPYVSLHLFSPFSKWPRFFILLGKLLSPSPSPLFSAPEKRRMNSYSLRLQALD